MNRTKKSLSVLLLGAVGAAGVMFGNGLVKDVQYAHAQEAVQSSREQLAKAEDLASVFRNVGKAVEPSVVNIQVRKTVKGVHSALPFDEDTLRQFFPDRDGDGEPDLPEGFKGDGGEGFDQIGTGSGVIMEVNGSEAYILTNNHVAGNADEMEITLADGRHVKNGKLVGADPKTDLAVVKISADRLIAAKWGDSSSLQKGDWIMAFGSPFGFIGSMTHGIVSALDRRDVGILRSSFGYENFIQVDAPINPGNSGGPLVDVQGNVVGINTAIASRSGGFQGIGFAIPSNQAKYVYEQLKTKGKVIRGWLGVAIASVDDPKVSKLAEDFGFKGTNGVFVQQVMEDTPATGKLQPGDIVTKIDGKEVKNVTELRERVAQTPPGKEINLTVFRENKEQDVKLKLGEQPDDMKLGRATRSGKDNGDDNTAEAKNSFGMTLTDLSDQNRERFGLEANVKGALVRELDPKSPAAKEGIRVGDVITKVGKTSVANAKEAREALAKVDAGKGISLYVVGRDASRFVFLQSDK